MQIFHKTLIPISVLLLVLLSAMIYVGLVFYFESKNLDTSLEYLKQTESMLTRQSEAQHTVEISVLSYQNNLAYQNNQVNQDNQGDAHLQKIDQAEKEIDAILMELQLILSSITGRKLLNDYIEQRFGVNSIRFEFLAAINGNDQQGANAAFKVWSVKRGLMHAVFNDIVTFNINEIDKIQQKYSTSRDLFINVIGVFLLVALCLLILSLYFFRRLVVDPITALKDMALSYGQGDFSRELPDLLQDAKGDFFSLSQSFLKMATELDETTVSRDEAQEMTRKLEDARHRIEAKARQHIAVSEALSAARDEAEMANKAKSEFLASMSHEIRTPMTGVMGLADMLLEEDLDEDNRDKVFKIKDSTRSLLRIINDILDMSKMEVGKMELENIDFHFPSLIHDTLNLFAEKRGGHSNKSLHFEALLNDNFPVGIKCDPIRIRQVLVNLIGNAVKFTREGTITVEGRLVPSANGKYLLRVAVMDTGIGIRPGTIPKLFSDFTQADASITRHFEGTGLGLAICKRLVTLMGGEIGVDSQFGKGSTFWFTLPYIAATTEVHERVGDRTPQGSNFNTLRPLSILVAEDNSLNQQVIMSMMTNLGHQTDMADNGAEAAEKHLQNNYDLILMDVRMPLMSGPDATQIIRMMEGMKAEVPIIALTADAMEENKKGYYESGMNEVVTKPIDRNELVFAINKVVGETIHVPLLDEDSEAPGGFKGACSAKSSSDLTEVEGSETAPSGIGEIGTNLTGPDFSGAGLKSGESQFSESVKEDFEQLLLEISSISDDEDDADNCEVVSLRN